jgi:hypothetical protein
LLSGFRLFVQKEYAEAELPLRKCPAIWEKRIPHAGAAHPFVQDAATWYDRSRTG